MITDEDKQAVAKLTDQIMNDLTKYITTTFKSEPNTLAAIVIGLCNVLIMLSWAAWGKEKAPGMILSTMNKCIEYRKRVDEEETEEQ